MTEIDQFESVFKSADKILFSIEPIDIRTILVVTDLAQPARDVLAARIQSFLGSVDKEVNWRVLGGDEFSTVTELVAAVSRTAPDLVVTHRNLYAPATEHPYSLGIFLDVLTQATDVPILVVPHPRSDLAETSMENTDRVMAITDHLTGDHHLVSVAAHLTSLPGTLYLTHVEDRSTFDRYVRTIGKIPEIDTDTAARAIQEQLLKEPADFIRSCQVILEEHHQGLRVENIVILGHHLSEHCQLIDEHHVDLLVLNTKDDEQLAMHGLAYPLSIELRKTPLLML